MALYLAGDVPPALQVVAPLAMAPLVQSEHPGRTSLILFGKPQRRRELLVPQPMS